MYRLECIMHTGMKKVELSVTLCETRERRSLIRCCGAHTDKNVH